MNPRAIRRAATGVLAAAAAALASAADSPLAAEQWKTRPLVVFAASAEDPLLARLRADLRRTALRDAFAERDMVLYTVVGDQARRGEVPLPAGEAAALRSALAVGASTPQAVLVGLDGGVKLRQSDRVDLAAIFVTIDGMPMRRR